MVEVLACSTRRRRRARRLPPAAQRLHGRRGVDRVRPSPLGTALRRALPAFGKRVVAGFSASRDASPRHDGSRAERPGRVGSRRGAFESVGSSFGALREALSPTASGAARIAGAAADT